jgi:putative salt-induced outer membrane protein
MILLIFAMVLVFRTDAWADHLVLKNGDMLTGKVTSQSASDVTIETELAGRLTLKRTDIASLTTSQASPDAAPQAPARWQAAINAGWDLSRGNAETATISTYGTATRLGRSDRFGLFGSYLFSNIGSGSAAVTTAKAVRGGSRYDHDLTRATFAFGFGEAEHDPPQLLELRTVFGGGAGAHLRKTATSQFNVFAGVSYARDRYTEIVTTETPTTPTTPTTPGAPSTPPGQGGTPPGQARRGGTPPDVVRTETSRQLGEFLVGEDWNQQLSDGVYASQSFRYFPAFGNAQDYRLSFDLSLSAQLNGWLQWNVTVSDRYLNIPPAGGAVQNDLFVSTGLGVTFGGGGGAYKGADGPPRRR